MCVCAHVVCDEFLKCVHLKNAYALWACQVRCFKDPLLSLLFTDVNEKENKMDGNRSVHKGRTLSGNSRKWLNIPKWVKRW